MSLLPKIIIETLPADNDGEPLPEGSIARWVGRFVSIEWLGFGITLWGDRYRSAKDKS